MTEKKVMIVTGEASGDMHGANLIKAMKAIQPDLSVYGMGGEALIAQGMEPLYDAAKLSVIGILEVFSHLRDIRAAQHILGRQLKVDRPGLLILIDLPDFNLMLAKKAKKLGIPVFYYISPQVWAWRSGRVKKIKRLVDRMAVIMPFEKDFYQQRGMAVDFVGHPLLDEVKSKGSRAEFLVGHGIEDTGQKIIGILPGSRRKEVAAMLPVFIEAARLIAKKLERTTFLLPVAPTLADADLAGYGLEESGLDIRLIRGDRYDLMGACDAVVAASGTVTLELGILKVPMVVSYRLSPISYFLGRRFIKVDYASLINLIAGREVVPELLQENALPGNISAELLRLLVDKEACALMKKELAEVVDSLGGPGASRRAAELALAVALWH
ncbi:MAG: lipid-A-disaccharide synthase [Thermodesulfobacteriota bacterium]